MMTAPSQIKSVCILMNTDLLSKDKIIGIAISLRITVIYTQILPRSTIIMNGNREGNLYVDYLSKLGANKLELSIEWRTEKQT